ncbi:12994_t:CDS:10 [Ambispora leptoticha]|uniref:12994_t:CDS:1 n=1 Tax=Ambispora leptoticha TaxID=144679 RepID=A0A9N9BPA8_9GLOM|nr:12994_t:CDS:10 [Ambispora leptoticha]
MPKCLCSKCRLINGKQLSWRTWRQHQRNNYQHITSVSINSLSQPTLTNLLSQELETFDRPSDENETSYNFDDENRINHDFDDENEINYDSNNENGINYDLDDENGINYDFDNSTNIAELSSYTENSVSFQGRGKLTPNKISFYKPKNLPIMRLDCLPDDFDQSDQDSTSCQSDVDQSEQYSNPNQSDKNDNSDQDEYEEIDINEETDDEDYEKITPFSSSLNVDLKISDIFLAPSYNPVRLSYNPPLLKENYVIQWPKTIYPYQSITARIASILADKSNERLMDSPFKRQIEKGVLGDIYDGKVWQEFLDEQGQPFFVGDKAEPIVNELKQLWVGQLFQTSLYPIGRIFRCALIQIACDIPAARKVTGLAPHSSKHACSKCTRVFPCFSGSSKIDYSNYIQEDPPLTNAEHRRIALQYKISDSTARKKIFQQYGIRWTCLLELPYIDIPRFTTIDPMHNIFLGTSKRIMQRAWMNDNFPKIGIKQLYEIQSLIDATPLPVDMGRINFKITSGFNALTADQWKTWVLIYSTYVLHQFLDEADRQCWQAFVTAVSIWSQRIITEAEIEAGHITMMAFLQYSEQIYGKRFCTPNMHLHKHLRECMLDYGPWYSFWCFTYERYNGELGLFSNSNRNMELEVLENFNHQVYIQQIKAKAYHYLPQDFLSSLDLIAQMNIEKTGTLGHYNFTVQEALDFRAMSGGLINRIVTGSEQFPGHFIGPFHEITLSTKIIEFLVHYYSNIYPNYSFHNENQTPKSNYSILVSSTARRATALKLGDEIYSSFYSRSDLNSNIFARWQLDDGKRINWPGVIKFFFEHRISLPSSTTPTSHYLAIIDWYKRDLQKQSYFYVKSRDSISKNILSTNADGSYHAELWEDRFVERGFETILPIQRIIGRFVKTSITSLTQTVNEIKSLLTSSDVKGQLETTKNSVDSLKRRLDIYEQNQSEFVTSIQRINNEHGIKIQRIEDTLITTTTILENLSTSTLALQTTMNSLLPSMQNHNSINISNATINSPHAITTANPILTAKLHDKMRYFNGFDDFEPPIFNNNYIYNFEFGPKNRKNKRITQNYVDLFIKEFDVQFEETQTNETWNEATIIEIAEAYFKTLKKERNTTPAAKILNDQRSRRRRRRETKSSNRLAALNKIPEDQLLYSKSEVEKLLSFEAMSPEVSDDEEMVSSSNEQDNVSELSRKKLLIPVFPWMSIEGNRIRNLVDNVVKRTRVEKLNSGGRHSYIAPIPREIVKMDDPRWIKMRSLIPARPEDLPIWAWNSDEYFDEIYDE